MNKISSILVDQLPEFVKADHPNFIAFMEAYYEFCEQVGGVTYTSRNNWDDIDNTLPQFLEFFYNDYLPLFPDSVLGNKILLAKNAKSFYNAKGTEKSFKLLFRVLFNEDVEFYYPKQDILRVSAGKWSVLVSLRIAPEDPDNFDLFSNLEITGLTSGATALVDSTKVYSSLGTTIYELFISSPVGTFLSSEEISATFTNPDGSTIQLRGHTLGILSNIEIVNPGANNRVGDTIPITGGGGVGASAFVSEVTDGQVTDLTIVNPGAGFLVNDQLIFNSANGSGANAFVQRIDTFNKNHPDFLYLNSDIIGAFDNISMNATTFATNVSGKVSVSANSINVIGSNTHFLNEVGPSVALKIGNDTRLIASVANNTFLTVNSAYSSAQTNVNGVVATAMAGSNANSTLYAALVYNIAYGPCGPINKIKIVDRGTGYDQAPTVNVAAYIPVKNLGIIGAIDINNPGTGYAVGEELTFTTLDGFGRHAAGYISSVAANGAITGILLAYPKITGFGNVFSTSNTVLRGIGTSFTTDLVVGDSIVINNEERLVSTIANNTWLTTNSAFSTANANVRIGKKYDFIGGTQYNSTDVMPTITVGTISGANANLTVGSLMATGEDIRANTLAGAIVAVTITNPGVGYTSNVTIDMSKNGDGTAILVGDVLAGAYRYPGRYLDSSSLLDSSSKIQDRDYYQNFSYVLKSKVPFEKYATALKNLAHPIGMKVFAETQVESTNENADAANFEIDTIGQPDFQIDFRTGAIPDGATFTRSSTGTYFNTLGVLVTANNNVPRFDHDPITHRPLGYLSEMQSTNVLTNSILSGAIPGTPGTMPTNTSAASDTGLSTQVIGSGSINGIPYVDVRFFGIMTTNGSVGYVDLNGVFTSSGDVWTTSAYVAMVGGSLNNIQGFNIIQFTFPGPTAQISASFQDILNGSLQRISFSSTQPSGATSTNSRIALISNLGAGHAIDITLRIGLPQMELSTGMTSPILTSGTTVTRAADILTLPLASMPGWDANRGGVLVGVVRTSDVQPAGVGNFQAIVTIYDGTSDNAVILSNRDRNTGGSVAAMKSGGGFLGVNGPIPIDFARTKIAMGWAENKVSIAVNGAAPIVEIGNLALPINPTILGFGQYLGNLGAGATIESISYYVGEHSNTFIQTVST